MTNPTELFPAVSVIFRYVTAAIALVDASDKTHNSLLTAAEGEVSV